jgi:prepilin-type N-terminal cleavage/methylation domain-containing protein
LKTNRTKLDQTGGFSLVELLVVIAVIGLLLSILVPALGRARGQADVITCKARLRQLGLGALMYAEDNEARLAVDPAMLGPSHENGLTGKWVDNPHLDLVQLLTSYVETPELYYCQTWKNEAYLFSPENVAKGEMGYFYFSVEKQPLGNGGLSTFLYSPRAGDPMVYPRRLKNTMRAQTWIASDFWFSGKGDSVDVAHRWYGKGVNYVMLDGSTDMVRNGPRQAFR